MATDLAPAIEAIWQRSRAEIDRRIATLEEALTAMRAGTLADDLRERAVGDAHKLAGSLAMFGFATGSELAREFEQALGSGDGCAVHSLAASVLTLRDEFDLRSRPARHADHVLAAATPPLGVEREILVIDDSALIRGIVQIGLGDEPGWRVRVAGSGAEGLELASHELPDAILLDVEMPGLDGPATLARLRTHEFAREIPVLFLTGHGTAADRARLTALGAAGVIAKPFDPASLASQIARLLGWAP